MRAVTALIVITFAVLLAAVYLVRDTPTSDLTSGHSTPAMPVAADPRRDDALASTDPSNSLLAETSQHEDCSDIYAQQMQQLYDDGLTEERINQIIQEAESSFGGSTQLELKLFAAQLIDAKSDVFTIFEEAISRGPVSPHFLWSAVNACLVDMQTVDCPAEYWLQRLLAVDSENSLAWMHAAGYYYAMGNLYRAKEALDRATIAYEANSYWYEDIMSAKAGADAIGGFSERASYLMAIGFAAGYPAPTKLYTDMCNTMSVQDSNWAYSCAAFGDHVAETGTSTKTRQVARSIRANALVALGEDQASELIQSLQAPAGTISDRDMLRYPNSIMLYMAALENGSEADAADYLLAENERRRQDPAPPACGDFRLD